MLGQDWTLAGLSVRLRTWVRRFRPLTDRKPLPLRLRRGQTAPYCDTKPFYQPFAFDIEGLLEDKQKTNNARKRSPNRCDTGKTRLFPLRAKESCGVFA